MVALQHPNEYPMNEGKITSTRGLQIAASDFENHFAERQVRHSTALQAVKLPQETPYVVGPLARLNLNRHLLSQNRPSALDELPIRWPCFNPFQSIVARALEVIQAFEESIAIINNYDGCSPAKGKIPTPRKRGMLGNRSSAWHDLPSLSDNVRRKNCICQDRPPTSQNQRQIEQDLVAYCRACLTPMT